LNITSETFCCKSACFKFSQKLVDNKERKEGERKRTERGKYYSILSILSPRSFRNGFMLYFYGELVNGDYQNFRSPTMLT
jgi:hypothetical protein